MNKIGIIGFGFVGKAVNQFSAIAATNIYDVNNKLYNSIEHKTYAYNSDIIFINVPTGLKDGRLDISIIEECMRDYLEFNNSNSVIVIKSTVSVGTCTELALRFGLNNLVFNPEFLSQRTAMQDFVNEKELYLAGQQKNTFEVRDAYERFFAYHSNYDVKIFETPHWEQIELLKLARNAYYGVKVSYCNYLYNLCEKANINYSTFREHFARGEWVGQQHTKVPGTDGKFGYGGKCLPKDSIELLNYAKKQDIMFDMLEKSSCFNQKQRNKND